MAKRGKPSKFQPILENHFKKPLKDILADLPEGMSCRQAAEALSSATGVEIKQATLAWMARNKADFKFTATRGRKPNSTLSKPKKTKTAVQKKEESIIHYECQACNKTTNRKEKITPVLNLINFKCPECDTVGEVLAKYKCFNTGNEFRKTISETDNGSYEIFVDMDGKEVDAPLSIENKTENIEVSS